MAVKIGKGGEQGKRREKRIKCGKKIKRKGKIYFFGVKKEFFREGGNDFNVKYLPNYLNFFSFLVRGIELKRRGVLLN